jgi:LysR family hydrogen peroxide-inducible transcriptional activator
MTDSLPTLRELQHFAAVAESASFARAAEACGLTQPAISRSVSRLEAALGVQLLERTTHYVRLTPFGETALAECRGILDRVVGLKHLAARETAPLTGRLRIGVIPTLCPYLLPYLLPALDAQQASLVPSIWEAQTEALVSALHARDLDVALLALPTPPGQLESHPLFVEPFWFAAPARHHLARHATVSEAALADEPILLLAEGHCLRDQALDICRMTGADPGGLPDVAATSIETLIQLVRGGTGTTLVPALAVPALAPRGPEVALRPIAGDRTHRTIGLVHRRGDWRTRAFAHLADWLREAPPADYVRPCAGEAEAVPTRGPDRPVDG